MKTQKRFANRILSLVLVLVMVVSMLPMTAHAATEAMDFGKERQYITYSSGTAQYFFYENYLYKAVYTNIKVSKIGIAQSGKYLVLKSPEISGSHTTLSNESGFFFEPEELPKNQNSALEGYSFSPDFSTSTGRNYVKVVTITCMAVGDPVWNWNGTASATARFTSTDGSAAMTVDATIESVEQTAASCLEKDKVTYTATATANGQTYTDTKTVDGEAGPHSYTYTADGFVLTEKCANGCGHQAIADITAGEAIYTGSAITNTATISYTAGTWAGDEPVLSFENNVNVGTATAKMTAGGATASTTFKINPANISYTTVTLDPENGTYNGNAFAPSVTVTFNGATLIKDTDYTLSWDKSGFTNAGSYTATITGKGNFEGTKNAVFSINPADIKPAIVTLDQNTFFYDGQPHKPTASVTFNGATLTEGVDYEVYYLSSDQIMKRENGEPVKFFGTGRESCDSINAGQYYAVVFGKGNFADNSRFAYAAYTIKKATVTEPTIESKTYDNTAQTADVPASDLYTVGQNNGGIDAGNYDIVLKLTDSANYKWATTDDMEVTLQFKITQAGNAWVTAPSIIGWTYGEPANAPTGEAEFGTVYVLYDGIANDGTTYDSGTPPTKAGSYVAWIFADGTANYESIGDGVEFIIAKADQAVPAGIGKEDETISKKSDGKITGVAETMEYRAEGESTYTAITGNTIENLAAGKYYVRVKGDSNHNPSPETEVNIAAGRMLTVTLPQTQAGYTLTVDKTEFAYNDSLQFTFELHDGYTMTDDFSAKFNNVALPVQDGNVVVDHCIEDAVVTVEGIADITPPAAEIKIEENKWNSFLNDLTFGLFFKETQDVTITASDKGSGVKSIQYYLTDREMERGEVETITDWIDYNGTFKVSPDNKYVIYGKITDHDGNVEYINSEGIVLDATAPVIEGIENGKTYYTTQSFTVKESNLESVTVNGNLSMTLALGGNVDKEYVITATDKAGNTTTVTVKMKPIKELAKATENLGNDNVTSADAPALEELVEKLDELIADPDTSDDGERETLEQHKAIAESLLQTIEDAAKALDTENTKKVEDVTAENVTPEDKTDLEKAKADLEKALDDNSDNYTEDEKKAIGDEIKRIDDALQVIGKVEAVEDLINKLPNTIKKEHELAVKAAEDAYNALSDYEKSLVGEDVKKALDDAKAALAEPIKPADPNSPQTGDNSSLWLWFTLLFVSGTGLFGMTLCDRKRRAVSKR